jgi:hypothetical protein
MTTFCVSHLQRRTEFKLGSPVQMYEGAYRGGLYHLIKIDPKRVRAEFVTPEVLNSHMINGFDQALPQGRLTGQKEIGRIFFRAKELQAAGKFALDEKLKRDPAVLLVSDASNSPFNEAHFAIQDGKILPLPEGSQAIRGKHYVLSTAEGAVSFPLVDTGDPGSVQSAAQGFMVPKIIHEGNPVRLLDGVTGTGNLSLSYYRGHIGQIFVESAYSKMGSPERVAIHTQLLEYLREPIKYMELVKDIMNGMPVSFGEHGAVRFIQNSFNHTYWIESENGSLYLFKTYPSRDLGRPAGVTFNEGPDLIFEVAKAYAFRALNAFIGTDGKDVRVILPKDRKPEAIRTLEGYPCQTLGDGKYFDRSLANFIVFSEV